MKVPLIVAHRGDSMHAPENTIAAFEQAISKGADAVELDVHLTKDNELVVHHDFYLGRTNNGTGFISDFTFAELSTLDAGSWFDSAFATEKLPTLQEVLRLGKGKIRFEIELKGTSKRLLDRVIATITNEKVSDIVELTSSHIPLLIQASKTDPSLRLGMFFSPLPSWTPNKLGQQQILDYLTLSKVQVAHLPISRLDQDSIKQLHDLGFLAYGANLNQEEDIERGILLGIDQMSTENIDYAVTQIRQM